MGMGLTIATKSTGAALVLAGVLGAGFCLGGGLFTDTFMGEDVHIYKFTKPPRFGESP